MRGESGQAADLVHDVSGEVGVAEGDDSILDQAPALVEVSAGADLLLQAGWQERQQQGPHLCSRHEVCIAALGAELCCCMHQQCKRLCVCVYYPLISCHQKVMNVNNQLVGRTFGSRASTALAEGNTETATLNMCEAHCCKS